MEIQYRLMKPTEYRLLPNFLYHAIYVPEGVAPPDRAVLQDPELRKYYEDFGRAGDSALLAVDDAGRVVGAIWGRVWAGSQQGYGYVNAVYPEITLSVLPAYRGMGIGKQLLERYLDWAKRESLPGLSLSVTKDNYALRLYEKAGFKIEREGESDYIMSLDLSAQAKTASQ